MARQLAHANGGELRLVDPERADGRARFELSLPLAPDAAPVEAAARRDPPGSAGDDRDPRAAERPPVPADPRDSALQRSSSP
jgi:hypothetical protein